jgi:toxin-antitoxin system PIN domain toxin
VIAFDSNLLVYSHREDSEFHSRAKELVESARHQAAPWAVPWACIHEFIAIVTHSGIYKPASTLSEAFGFLDALFASPQLQLLSESSGYFDKLRALASAARLKGPRIHDARIAALCLHHGVSELWSADRDFSAFPQLKVRNPMVKKMKHFPRDERQTAGHEPHTLRLRRKLDESS